MPFVTIMGEKQKINNQHKSKVIATLTRYSGTIGKSSRNFRVHVDKHILFFNNCCISLLDPLLHPLNKRLTNNTVYDVHNELFWEMFPIFFYWKIGRYLLIFINVWG